MNALESFQLPILPVDLPDNVDIDQGLRTLKQLFNASPLAILVTDTNLESPGPTITFANEAMVAQSGFDQNELIHRTPRVLQGPRTDRSILNQLRHDLANDRVFVGETVNYRKNGTPYRVQWSIVPIRHRGVTVRFLSFQNQITGAPAPFYPSAISRFTLNDPFEAIFDTAEIGIAIINRDFQFVRVNESLCRWLDYQIDEMVGRPVLEFCADLDSLEETIQALEGVFEGFVEMKSDFMIRHRDGHTVTLRGQCKVLKAIAGEKFIVWSVTDVTQQRVLEERLRIHEQRLDLAIHGCGLGFWDCDCLTREVYFSPGWKMMLGYADHELANRHEEWISRVHPSDLNHVLSATKRFLEGSTKAYQIEYRLRHHDESYRTIMARGAAVRDENGVAVRFAGTHTDISDRSRLENELRQTQKLDAIGQLAGGIAHDFNNLLTVILGNLDLLSPHTNEPGRPYLKSATMAALRAADLSGKLLSYARRTPLTRTAVNITTVLNDVVTILKPTIDPRIAIRVEVADSLPIVSGDEQLLFQAILNLALNARDAMPNGGNLTLRAESPNTDRLIVIVEDTGVGMDAATKARLFEPFFTTKPVGRGTGMGLAVAYGTIVQHGGHIRVESEVKRGSRFEISLPAQADIQTKDTMRRTALIIDDEDAIRTFARFAASKDGWHVRESGDVDRAIDLLKKEAVDVILLDLHMPGLSGESAFRAISLSAPSTPIVLISGGDFDDAWHREAHGQLRKPFDRSVLLNEMNRHRPLNS